MKGETSGMISASGHGKRFRRGRRVSAHIIGTFLHELVKQRSDQLSKLRIVCDVRAEDVRRPPPLRSLATPQVPAAGVLPLVFLAYHVLAHGTETPDDVRDSQAQGLKQGLEGDLRLLHRDDTRGSEEVDAVVRLSDPSGVGDLEHLLLVEVEELNPVGYLFTF